MKFSFAHNLYSIQLSTYIYILKLIKRLFLNFLNKKYYNRVHVRKYVRNFV